MERVRRAHAGDVRACCRWWAWVRQTPTAAHGAPGGRRAKRIRYGLRPGTDSGG